MEKLVVKIEKLDHQGRGIARINGIPVFIENALINEVVEIEITNKKKNYMEGKVVDYLETSSNRIKPKCPYFKECGGCDIMNLSYEDQLKYKEEKTKEILSKFANINNINKIISSCQFYYRNKLTLQVKKSIGLYKRKSYDLIPIEKCYITDDKINKIISLLKKINLDNIKQIVIRVSKKDSMIVFYIKDDIKINLDSFEDISTIITIKNKNQKILKGQGYIIEELLGLKFIISPTSFFQVNNLGMTNLYNQILKYLNLKGNEQVLDLYCGTGSIGLYLAKYCKNVLGIEINSEAIKDANKNKKINQIFNINFQIGDVSQILQKNNFNPDVIIVDPPRAGLDTITLDKIMKLNPEKLIYVSCDPITLARDLNILKTRFDIKEITPVDMFGNTYHVETVCVLERR